MGGWSAESGYGSEFQMVGKSPRFALHAGEGSRVPAETDPTPCCDRPERSLLLLYALSRCAEEEALDFEAHLLDCDACFEDLKTLDRARTLIREALNADSPVLERIRSSLRDLPTRGASSLSAHLPPQ